MTNLVKRLREYPNTNFGEVSLCDLVDEAAGCIEEQGKRISKLEADLRSAGKAYENMMGVYLKERERIRELEDLLARASEQMSAWQDPMSGPFERILLDIQEALADDE